MTNKSDLASAAKDRFACASTSIRRTPMSSTHDPASLDQRCIDTLRFLSVDMVQKADSGHPGLPLGAAPLAYVLWQQIGSASCRERVGPYVESSAGGGTEKKQKTRHNHT